MQIRKHEDYIAIAINILNILLIPIVILQFQSYTALVSRAQSVPSFTFTAAGDFNSNSRTTAVLNGIKPSESGADFNWALGDLSYGNLTPETVWCDYVKGIVGDTFPFELIPGNHEDDGPAGNNINNFEQCLPDRLGGFTGRYSREYYFDYPAVEPLARFIAISPNMIFTDEGQYNYTPGSSHYNFVANAIDSARGAGIKWIVAGMHVNCISMGRKPSCTVGEELFNLLIEKKVDLILQGHDHTYQRSKQLSFGPSCSAIVPGTYNQECVADDGADNIYTKGSGSVLTIAGTGGGGLYDINTSDSEAGYFTQYMGNNINQTWGFVKAQVSSNLMSVTFVPRQGTFTDSFIIEDTSTPTMTPEPPTETPIPSPTPTIDPNAPTPTDTPIPTDTPVPTETPIASPTPLELRINPVDDSFVSSQSPNGNFGGNSTLKIDGSPLKMSYLKFDLGSLAGRTIQSAILRLIVTDKSNSFQNLKSVSDNSWTESTITFNNRPFMGGTITTFQPSVKSTWKDIEITSFVANAAGEIFSLGIDSAGTDSFACSSKDSSSNKPELVINYQ